MMLLRTRWLLLGVVVVVGVGCQRTVAVLDTVFGYDAGTPSTSASSSGGTVAVACNPTGVDGNNPPQFQGVADAVPLDQDGVTLTWTAATDETAAAELTYLIFTATTSGGEDLEHPTTTVTGATTTTLTGLGAGPLFVMVRARDAQGLVDCNTTELSVVVGAPSDCVDFATRVQPIFSNECIQCHRGASAPRGLQLDTHAGVMAGGATGNTVVACQPDTSLLYLKVSQVTPPVGARMPADGPPYLTDAQILTLRTWIAEGARSDCGQPNPCLDDVLPTFDGLVTADLVEDTTAVLCWEDGTDNNTPTDQLLYDVYEALTPTGEDFGAPPKMTSPPGATCVARTGLTPGQEYCWIVRVRDGSGNTDGNTVERCVTTPAANCIDFTTIIQPIFNQECIHCHSGAGAPQGLRLDSYAGVRTGGATGSTVVACQAPASLLYQKVSMASPPVGVRMPADGPPYLSDAQMSAIRQWINEGGRESCAGANPCSDANPPTFGGLSTAEMTTATTAALCWTAATDDASAPEALLYDVYEGTVPGGQVFSSPPRATSDPGATCINRTGLTPGQQYCFVVRARDGAGNRDQNTTEVCVTAPMATCVDYETMVQPIFTTECIHCHSGATAPRNLRLDSYQGLQVGGLTGGTVVACQPNQSLLFQKVSMSSPPVGSRMPLDGPPYLTDAQMNTLRQWIAEGARASCDGSDPCSDMVPPTFAGITQAMMVDASSASLCWAPGADDTSPATNLIYDVYEGVTPGGQIFTAPASQVSAAGETCVTRAGLTPGQQYCYVVRARDAAGNRDQNTVELCVTVPAATCIDYAQVIQPIFNQECIHCHSGPTAPRSLSLETYGGVLAGGLTGSTVVACQPSASLLAMKISMSTPPVGSRMPLDGPPYLSPAQTAAIQQWISEGARSSCSGADPCSDVTPPTFAGLVDATVQGDNGAVLSWLAANDNATSPASLVYDVYDATTPGGQVFTAPPRLTSAPGLTTLTLSGLTPGQQYCYVVRARDGAGNRDQNTVERCITIPMATCVDFSTMVQPIFNQECIHCHSGATPPRNLRLDNFTNVVAGGLTGNTILACQPGQSLLFQKISMTTPPIGSRMPLDGPPFLTGAQQDLINQWIAQGARASCADADPCSDMTPPTFGGLVTATLSGASTATLGWAAATDNATAQADILYDVYEATTPGGQAFSSPPRTTSTNGALSMTVSGLTPGQQYCYVVRARDAAGNRDQNTTEHCITVPAASCVDFSTVVQPIFNQECIHCHSGANPPQGLRLDSFAGVSAGGATGSTVVACQPSSSLLFQKVSMAVPPRGVRMPADGPPYLTTAQINALQQWISEGARSACNQPDPCSDVTAPTFAGVTNATLSGASGVALSWAAGSDDTTAPTALVYDVYSAVTPGGQAFTSPPADTSAPGVTTLTVQGLTPGQEYCFVVRARDAAGNRDQNTVERCVTIPAASCVDYATVVQPIFNQECIHCHSGATAPRNLHLDSFAGVTAGGLSGNTVVACQSPVSLLFQKISMSTPPVGARMPADGPPYLTTAQINAIQQWIEEGARSACNLPDPCSDAVPPVFGGLVTALLSGDTGAALSWAAGSDNVTATGALLYDVYEATAPGGQVFTNPPRVTSPAGALSVTLTGLTPGQQYCYVVRARDGAGNQDQNTVERCITVPMSSCMDFATVIQPIFNQECIHCHSGATPPRNLRLDSYSGVTAGGLTGNTVVSCQPSQSLLFQKISMATPPVGVRMPADGPPYLTTAQINAVQQWISEGGRQNCAAPDPCSDATPPTFAGASSVTAVNATTASVCWAAATDNVTPQGQLLYDVYTGATPTAPNVNGPAWTTSAAGATCATVTALSPGGAYCFTVRARDGAGNRDQNTTQQCVTLPTLPTGCVDYASMIQPLLDRNCTRCHAGTTPPQWLRLDTYDNVMAGSVRRNTIVGCNAAGSLLVNKIGASPSVGRRMPYDGPPYLTAAQISMVNQWVTNGAARSCAEPGGCTDTTAPTFGGVTSATALDNTTVRVCWNAATDNTTPASGIRYEIYDASASRGQSFNEPAQHAVVGATCLDIPTGAGVDLCFVVRARDRRGNVTNNAQEQCVSTPAAACALDYLTDVQPVLTARCAYCHSGPNAPRFLDLSSMGGLLAGGSLRDEVRACNWAQSRINLKTAGQSCGQRMPFGGPWLAASERALLQSWVQSGARRNCADPTTCSDVTPPVFGGATSAVDVDGSTVEVCWSPASDDTTPADAITYEVFESATRGGQNFTRPAGYAVGAGATCLRIPTPAAQQSCYVVRARDLRGNRDLNTAERCATTANVCIDYATRVQPTFNSRCVHCHSGSGAPRGIRWDTYNNAINTGDVQGCDANAGKLMEMVEGCSMPRDTVAGQCNVTACLTSSQTRLMRQWIMTGADPGCPSSGCN